MKRFSDEHTSQQSRAHRRRRASLVVTVVAFLLSVGATPSPISAKVAGPNGRLVYDRHWPDGSEAVVTANPDGSAEQALNIGPGCCADWSPDGSKLAIAADSGDGRIGTAIVNADGSDRRVLPIPVPGLHLPCFPWSPDATRLACEGWDDNDPAARGIYTVRMSDGGDLVRLTYGGDVPGDYSPDGSQIAFVRGHPRRETTSAIFVVNTDGTGVRQVTPWGRAGCCTASWSPDGRWILFDARGQRGHALFTVHPDGTGLRRIPLRLPGWYDAFEPAWSPDGTKIAFSMYLPSLGYDDIYTVNAGGTGLIQVTNTPEHEGQVDWGPHPPAGT
jgi:Tol biopolymer transport system component